MPISCMFYKQTKNYDFLGSYDSANGMVKTMCTRHRINGDVNEGLKPVEKFFHTLEVSFPTAELFCKG